jgi:hypothetical protein
MLTGPSQEVPMRELLIDAAERAIRYLESLNERAVVPDPTAVARLAELVIAAFLLLLTTVDSY